jgi:hypothetical protein
VALAVARSSQIALARSPHGHPAAGRHPVNTTEQEHSVTSTSKDPITVNRDQLEQLIAERAARTLTPAEDSSLQLRAALEGGAFELPDGLSAQVEGSDDEDGSWIRLAIHRTSDADFEISTGWQRVRDSDPSDPLGVANAAASELNRLLRRCDPRKPSVREAILAALRRATRPANRRVRTPSWG